MKDYKPAPGWKTKPALLPDVVIALLAGVLIGIALGLAV
jgi:hypothetical protein